MKQTRKERKTRFYEAFLGLFLRLMGVVGGWWGLVGVDIPDVHASFAKHISMLFHMG